MRSILKLIDQQMLNPPIERKQELRRLVDTSECLLCPERKLDKIDDAPLAEHDFQLRSQMY